MSDVVKIAAVQMEPKITQVKNNLDKIITGIKNAASNGAKLIVFPECALTGYVFASRKEAFPYMETIPGPSTDKLAEICRKLNVYVVVGLLEKSGEHCYNAAAFIGPDGLIDKYRKNHLPPLGVDRSFDRGNEPFKVFETPIGNIGIIICYDCSFPESVRVLTLMGAEILALPTNWPAGRQKVPNYLVVTRAYENKIHVIAADRVGIERGTKFIGLSKIVNAHGDTLAQANGEDEVIIYGEVSLKEAREKRIVLKPGEIEMDFIHDRRPELYSKITEPL